MVERRRGASRSGMGWGGGIFLPGVARLVASDVHSTEGAVEMNVEAWVPRRMDRSIGRPLPHLLFISHGSDRPDRVFS